MKRVKILLTAVAVVAVAGGVLAFKANSFGSKKVYTTPDQFGNCTVTVTNKILTTTGQDLIWVTDVQGTPCISTYTVAPASN